MSMASSPCTEKVYGEVSYGEPFVSKYASAYALCVCGVRFVFGTTFSVIRRFLSIYRRLLANNRHSIANTVAVYITRFQARTS